ncbi:hypothetical protein EDB89DRAFT_1938232 [Lactarius sanguifluus]|nr:hypothetical protein EDB89DRAFT_1938232 [Lactarius sanguifluus]
MQMTTPKPTRRSPFSFLRSVKSLFLPSHPAESFVPALPHLDRSTPVPFPRSLFNRTFRKCPPPPTHPPGSDRRSFFDDDDDLVDNVDRRFLSLSRLSVSRRTNPGRTAHSNSRLSSTFAHTSPDLSSISSVVPASCSIAEQRDALRSDSRTDLRQSKASPISRLRTKISLTKLVSPNSQPSSSTNTSQALAPSSFSYHPYSDNGHAHPYAAQPPEDRSFTPEDDPFRKDEVAPAPLASSRFPDSSPGSTSIQTHGDSRKHLTGSRSLPVLPSVRSSGPDSPSPSARALRESGDSHSPSGPSQGTSCTIPPSQRHNMSPLSLTFPLPPSPQDSVPFTVPTVQVTPPARSPPPAYPPPLSPPPLEPLPCPPPVGLSDASPPEPLEGPFKEGSSCRRCSGRDLSKPVQKSTPVRRLHSHARADRSPSSFTDQYRAASSRAEDRDFRWTPEMRIPRKKNRPLTPFPLPLLAGQVKHDRTGRLRALEAASCLTSPQADPAIDQTAEAMTDSEVEPDLDFNSNKARKKISVSSAKSARSAISGFSTTSGSTTTSSTSIATISTAATTVSPSISTHASVDKTGRESQVLIADEDGTIVSTEMYSTLSPPDSPSPEIFAIQSAGIYLKQGGTMHEPPNDLLLAGGERVIVGATDWAEFRNFCDARHNTSLRLDGSTRGDGIADILVVEIQHSGKVRGVELLLYPRHPSLCTNVDLTRRIPGSYPLSDLPAVPRVSSSQSVCNEWSALALEGTPPLHDGPQLSGIRAPNEPNYVHDGEMRRTLSAFVTILPTTLRDLVMRAGDIPS